jgi:hypothetical protein
MSESKEQTWIDTGLVCGVIAGVLYPIGLLDLLPGRASHMAFMLFGPFLIVGVAGVRHLFARANDSVSNDLAHLMLGLSGVAFTFMATMQMSIYTLVPRYRRASTTVETEVWNAILRSVSSTQLGLDFAFDIFVSAGVVLLGLQMVRHPKIWTWFGACGMVIGALGLTANVATFPENSGDAGLIDPAPFFGAWLGLSAIPLIRLRRWAPTAPVVRS